MDKDEILNGPNKEGEWIEAQQDPDDPNSTPENTYAYVRRYADGRVVTEYYRRGQAGGPVRTKTSMDTAQEKRWKDQQAQAQRQQDQSERKVKRKYTGTDPQTGRPAIVTEYETGEPSYEEIKPPANTSTTAEPPTTKDEGGRRWVWQPNPGGPNAGGRWVDVGSAPETPAERQAREASAPTQTLRVEEVNGVKYTVITIVPKPGQQGEPAQVVLGPDGKQVAGGIPGKQPVESKDTVTGPDGKTYIRVKKQNPDGSVEIYHTDQAGNRTMLPDDKSKAPIPGDAPSFTPNQNEADLGLTAYARAVRQRTDLSKEQQEQLIREARDIGATFISRQTSTINTQEGTRSAEITQRGQDMSQTNARLSAANSVYGTALSRAGEDTKYSTGADAMAVAPYYLMLGQAAAQMFGGLQNTPRVQNGPAIQAVQQQGLPTVSQVLATAPGNPVAPAVDPAAAAAAEAARQQQIAQAGAVPPGMMSPPAGTGQFSPSPAPPVPPAQQPQSPGVPGMMMPNSPTIDPSPSPATEPLPPQAQGPNPAINPVTGEPTGLPPMSEFGQPGDPNLFAQPPAPVLVAPMTTEPQQQPSGGAFPPLPIVPRAGTEAGGNVQMAPVPQNPVAMALGAGPWQQQPQMQPTGAVGTQLMAADGAYDPASVNDEWLAAGADPAIVAMFGGGRRAVA